MESKPTSILVRLKSWYAHAFAVNPPEGRVNPEEEMLVEKIATFIINRKMESPVLMVLETGRPLNFVGSQFLTFLSPFLTLIFSKREYERFVGFLEKKYSIDILIKKITDLESAHDG